MNWLRLAAPWILVLSTSVAAQKPAPTSVPLKAPNKAAAPKEIDPEISQRRSIVMYQLRSLAIEARSYRDEALRARVQARIADALWDHDRDNARSLFHRAWDAAEAFETQSPSSSGASVPGRLSANQTARPRINLRAEILKLAARRDHALGEEFLRKMAAANQDDAELASDSSPSTPLSEAETRERLRLAGQFLEADNIQRALQFADPALRRTTMRAIQFLVKLRDKNAAAADQRFAALLAGAAADPASDANTVSQLTSYAFTPSTFLAVSDTGIPSSVLWEPSPAPDLAPALRRSFFRVAANILLRPLAQLDQSSAGRTGTYFIATRLFPLFQQHAPDLAPRISSQLAALGPEASRATLTAGDRSLNRGMGAPDPTVDGIADELKDRLNGAQGADARDAAYAHAAMRAAAAGDPRARDFVDKIEDLETRNGIRSVVDYSFINALLRKKNVEEAVRLARKSDLTPTLRSQSLTEAAEIVGKTDNVRALELLDEALGWARRIDAGTPERAYCLVALLAEFSRLDKVRGWELVGETVRAANAVREFTGEYGRISWKLDGKFSVLMGTQLAGDTDLPESFAALAEDDFYRALDTGKTFSGDAPRALVMVAIAHATLQEKPAKAAPMKSH